MAAADVIILGNTGFVGSRLQAHWTKHGANVLGFGSQALDLRHAEALTALDGLLDASTVLVVASASGSGSGMTAAGLADNVAMIANLVTYLQHQPRPAARKCIFLSSDAVYPMTDSPLTETSGIDVSNFYALSKFAGERLVQQILPEVDVVVLVLRLTAIFGPGDTHNAYGPNRFARQVAQRQPVKVFGNGDETRDHLYIEDAVAAIAALSAGERAGVLNLATGSSRSFAEVVDLLRTICPRAIEVESMVRRGSVTHRRFDTHNLADALPEFRFTPFEDALRATLEAAEHEPGN